MAREATARSQREKPAYSAGMPPHLRPRNNHGLFLALSAVIQLNSGQQNSHAGAY